MSSPLQIIRGYTQFLMQLGGVRVRDRIFTLSNEGDVPLGVKVIHNFGPGVNGKLTGGADAVPTLNLNGFLPGSGFTFSLAEGSVVPLGKTRQLGLHWSGQDSTLNAAGERDAIIGFVDLLVGPLEWLNNSIVDQGTPYSFNWSVAAADAYKPAAPVYFDPFAAAENNLLDSGGDLFTVYTVQQLMLNITGDAVRSPAFLVPTSHSIDLVQFGTTFPGLPNALLWRYNLPGPVVFAVAGNNTMSVHETVEFIPVIKFGMCRNSTLSSTGFNGRVRVKIPGDNVQVYGDASIILRGRKWVYSSRQDNFLP